MATVTQILDAIAPEFTGIDKTVQIDIAKTQTNISFFGTKYIYAVALRVAHNMTVSANSAGGGAGAVTSKREGDLAVSYSTSGSSNSGSNLNDTGYGRQLLDLIQGIQPFYDVTGGVENVEY